MKLSYITPFNKVRKRRAVTTYIKINIYCSVHLAHIDKWWQYARRGNRLLPRTLRSNQFDKQLCIHDRHQGRKPPRRLRSTQRRNFNQLPPRRSHHRRVQQLRVHHFSMEKRGGKRALPDTLREFDEYAIVSSFLLRLGDVYRKNAAGVVLWAVWALCDFNGCPWTTRQFAWRLDKGKGPWQTFWHH